MPAAPVIYLVARGAGVPTAEHLGATLRTQGIVTCNDFGPPYTPPGQGALAAAALVLAVCGARRRWRGRRS